MAEKGSGTPRFILNGKYGCIRPETLSAMPPMAAREPGVAARRSLWEGVANSFVTGVGPEPGEAKVLLFNYDLDKLDRESDAHFFDILCGPDRRKAKKLVFRKAICVTPVNEDQPNSAWLCWFQDRRALCQGDLSPISERYFRIPAAFANEYLADSTGSATWTALLTDLWNDCGTSRLGAFPGLPAGFSPDGAPEGWAVPGMSAWQALNTVLDRLKCGIRPVPETGDFKIVQLGADDDTLTTDRTASKGELKTRPRIQLAGRTRVPATVRVYFQRLYPHGLEKTVSEEARGGGDPPNPHQHLTNSFYSVDIDANDSEAYVDAESPETEAGLTHPIHDDLRARYIDEYEPDDGDDGNLPDNDGELAARAAERANDFYRDALTEQFQDIYLGFPRFRLGSLLKSLAYLDLGDGGFTSIGGGPGLWGGGLPEMGFADRPDSPPDFSRPTTPDYPPTDQVVRPGEPTSDGTLDCDVIRPDHTSEPPGDLAVEPYRSAGGVQDMATDPDYGTISELAGIGRQIGHNPTDDKPMYLSAAERVAMVHSAGEEALGEGDVLDAGDAGVYWDGRYHACGGKAHWAIGGDTVQTVGQCWIRTKGPRGSDLEGAAAAKLDSQEWVFGYYDGWFDPMQDGADSRPVLVIATTRSREFWSQLTAVDDFDAGNNWRGLYSWKKMIRDEDGWIEHPDGELGDNEASTDRRALNSMELGNDTSQTSGGIVLADLPTGWEPQAVRVGATAPVVRMRADVVTVGEEVVEKFAFEKGTDVHGTCVDSADDEYIEDVATVAAVHLGL